MMNYNNQVSPRNGVDFSRIRRYASGGGIPKYQPGTGRSGITYQDGTTWRESMFNQIRENIVAKLKDPNTSQADKDAYVRELNELQGAYAIIRRRYPNLNPTQFDEEVKKYQQQIIDKYNYVNTKGVTYGLGEDHSRYVFGQRNPKLRNTGDNAGADNTWAQSADGYFSGITQDRTLLGYRGDWDENSDSFKGWQNELKNYNLETYLDADGAYKLRPLNSSSAPSADGAPANNPDGSPSDGTTDPSEGNPGDATAPGAPGAGTAGTYTPTEYTAIPRRNRDIYTAIIPKAAILGNNLAGIERDYLLELQKKTPLKEALHNEFIAGNYKPETDAYNRSASDLASLGNQRASETSNIDDYRQTQRYYDSKANEQRLQGELAKAQGYRADMQKALEIANWNTNQSIDTANFNRQANVVKYNQDLAAAQKRNAARVKEISDFVNKESTDFRNWYTDQKQNDAVYQNDVNQYLANLDMQKALEPYTNLAKDPMSSNAFASSWAAAQQNYMDNHELADADLDDAGKEYRTFFNQFFDEEGNPLKSQDEMRQAYQKYLAGNTSTGIGKDYYENYQNELNAAYNGTVENQMKIKNQLAGLRPYFQATYNTGSAWLPWKKQGASYQSIFKEGGVLKASEGTKVDSEISKRIEARRKINADRERTRLQALRQNSAVEARSQKNAQIASKELQESLKRELESLDRESLLLLRSVFK